MMKLVDNFFQIVRSLLKKKTINNYQGLYYLQTAELKTADYFYFDDHEKKEQQTVGWYLQARELVGKSRYKEASLYYDQILRTTKNHVGALTGKGYCLLKLGRYRNALNYFSKALSYHKKNVELLNNIGVCYCRLQEYANALQYFEKALQYDRNSHVLWNNIGYCLTSLGRYDGACAAYRKALKTSGSEDVCLIGNAAAALLKSGNYRDAMYYFDRALQMTPQDPLLLNNAAVYLAVRGNYNSAVNCCCKALAVEPENSIFLCNKGMLLLEMGDTDKAAFYLHEALQRDRTNPTAWMGLAVLHLCKGSRAEALDCYNRSLGLE